MRLRTIGILNFISMVAVIFSVIIGSNTTLGTTLGLPGMVLSLIISANLIIADGGKK